MAKLAPLDGITRLPDQLDSDAAPVVLVNLFTADPRDEEALIAAEVPFKFTEFDMNSIV